MIQFFFCHQSHESIIIENREHFDTKSRRKTRKIKEKGFRFIYDDFVTKNQTTFLVNIFALFIIEHERESRTIISVDLAWFCLIHEVGDEKLYQQLSWG